MTYVVQDFSSADVLPILFKALLDFLLQLYLVEASGTAPESATSILNYVYYYSYKNSGSYCTLIIIKCKGKFVYFCNSSI